MRKHSRFFSRNENNIKKLLGQLAMRELQSEEFKITELVNKQKATLEAARSLKTSVPKLREGSLDKTFSIHHLKIGKENSRKQEASEGSNFSSKKLRIADHKSKLQKMSTTRYQRNFLQTKLERQEAKDTTMANLPQLFLSSKRNSIEKNIDGSEKIKRNMQSTQLDIIEETHQFAKLTKKPSINFHLSENHKERSLASSKK